MAKTEISLDTELVVEVMVLSGIGNPRDAIEAVVRDYVARGHRTETRTGEEAEARLREIDTTPRIQEG
ncbi:type II toxin-antitoxin system VapB family antitoxin [Streptomyces fenghuangensis]|uniref:Type II toxin-antitoxin system VapB family antitoxin n=1 Tax=Streptomyces chitinivorans TaxID=1257027 RepID=A0ABW7HRT7_9ACTN|nr:MULTISPECIES: type II toxin-antitoxin system VapB family antitoxin [Streptomyces]MCG3042682.1 type II toxin-antitoxin system VapB family antitoxin [Streptomyces sp. ICN903]MDH2409868.1 type II toxin-antitoxin system VapB family antitoxin [Streptomyces chitinivorans]